jgi:hydroxyacylglutathione hydrolase
MRVVPIACLRDNYAYLIADDARGECAIVDASDGAPVVEALTAAQLRLTTILATHHHLDHVGGNDVVRAAFPKARVLAGAIDAPKIAHVDEPLGDGAQLSIGRLAVRALHVPGHTAGAVAYFVEDPSGDAPWVFTGDVMFLAGCGRLFEGTPADMHHSLNEVLAALPDETRIGCGHEYTASNLRFAAHVEPENPAIAERLAKVTAMRAEGRPTVPGTLAEERATNPFMRVREPAVERHVGLPPGADPVEVLGRLRREKDSF